jgi:NADPH:quinone reductase-like Zn-dependent oxidoreductase
MNAIELTGPSISAFRRTSLADTKPRQGEALIALRAASLNFIDLAVAIGAYPGVSYPIVPVADGAGEVLEVGEGVDQVRCGDRVTVHPKALWAAGQPTARRAEAMRGINQPGSLRELACVNADTLVRVPDFLSWEEAAALPIAATTAWGALNAARIGPGRTVLVLGTGGVSIFALQFAKARGARVILTSSSDAKLGRARMLGADEMINYRVEPEWGRRAFELADDQGVDLVVETGGAATFAQSLAAVRHGGVVFTLGFLGGTRAEFDLMPVIVKAVRVQGVNTGPPKPWLKPFAPLRPSRSGRSWTASFRSTRSALPTRPYRVLGRQSASWR